MKPTSLKQITLYLLIIVIGIVLLWQLYYFIPGVLLAITLYIMLRKTYFNMLIARRWKRWLAAITLIALVLLVLSIPIFVIVQIMIPKISYIAQNSGTIIEKATLIVNELKERFPKINISQAQIQDGVQRVLSYVPRFLGTTASIITNLLTALFVLYFMLTGGEKMERAVIDVLPLRQESKDSIWKETHKLIRSNALGIPILGIMQAIIAALGYWIFGVQEFIVWGLLTGMCSLLPVIGTMLIWIPIGIYLFAIGQAGSGIGLLLYGAIVISNIDNVLRFTLLRKIGDVHPLITVFGVLAGLNIFGIMGLIFGPLLLSYFLLLIKIYRAEFSAKQELLLPPDNR